MEKFFEPVLFMKSDLDCCAYSLYLVCESGQYAKSTFDSDGLKIELGVMCTWEELIENLLHELEECYLLKEGKRFANTKEAREFESMNCVFLYTHTDLQMMCRAVGRDLARMQFKLHDAWEHLNKKHNDKLNKIQKKTKGSVKKEK